MSLLRPNARSRPPQGSIHRRSAFPSKPSHRFPSNTEGIETLAAIYARKRTEQNGVAGEAGSVARQADHARAYAARKGWAVADEHIYIDDGISGAEFARRPGVMRLM